TWRPRRSTGSRWRVSTPGAPSRQRSQRGKDADVRTSIEVTVNGSAERLEIDTRQNLVGLLREQLGLTGTHVGCSTGNCGARTVGSDGVTVKSCSVLAADVDGREVTTIEALSSGADDLHPIQQAFVANQGLQCGFCTPGMVLSVSKLLEENPDPTADDV